MRGRGKGTHAYKVPFKEVQQVEHCQYCHFAESHKKRLRISPSGLSHLNNANARSRSRMGIRIETFNPLIFFKTPVRLDFSCSNDGIPGITVETNINDWGETNITMVYKLLNKLNAAMGLEFSKVEHSELKHSQQPKRQCQYIRIEWWKNDGQAPLAYYSSPSIPIFIFYVPHFACVQCINLTRCNPEQVGTLTHAFHASPPSPLL